MKKKPPRSFAFADVRVGAKVRVPSNERAEVLRVLPDERLDMIYLTGPSTGQGVVLHKSLVEIL